MLKSKKLSVLFLAVALLFLFSGVKVASAKNGIFISTLTNVPGYKISKDYGFITLGHHNSNYVLVKEIKGQSPLIRWIPGFSSGNFVTATFKDINRYAPSGSNACINLKFRRGITTVCEYVRLIPKK